MMKTKMYKATMNDNWQIQMENLKIKTASNTDSHSNIQQTK